MLKAQTNSVPQVMTVFLASHGVPPLREQALSPEVCQGFLPASVCHSSLHVNGTPHKLLLNFQLLYFSLHPYEQGRPFFRWLCLSKPTYNTVFLVGRTQCHVILRPSPWNGQQFTALNSSHPTPVLSYPVAILVMTFSWFLMNVPYCSTQIVSFWEVPTVSWSFLITPLLSL